VIFVHLYGNPTNIVEVAAVCAYHGVPLIEDCAQAVGATYSGRQVGAFGAISAYSFYATKNLAAGEGGAVVTSDASLADYVRRFINHGRTATYAHDLVGYNYRMTDLHAALALDQLEHFERLFDRRQANARALKEALRPHADASMPRVAVKAGHAYHQFTVVVAPDRREALAQHLAADQIQSAVFYPTPLPRLRCFAALPQLPDASFGLAETASQACLSLPVHSDLGPAEIDRIVGSLRRFFEGTGARLANRVI
jgi:perosamine synthetase